MYAYCSSVAVLYLSVLHSSVFAVFVRTCIKVRKKVFFCMHRLVVPVALCLKTPSPIPMQLYMLFMHVDV